MLIDANAMVNIIDAQQPRSAEFRAEFQAQRRPFITTWAALVEAMYLLARIGGWSLQRRLWDLIQAGQVQLHIATAYGGIDGAISGSPNGFSGCLPCRRIRNT